MHLLRYITIASISMLLLPACNEPDAEAPAPQAKRFSPVVPGNLATAVPYPEHNPFTEEGVTLGRMLFYDPVLSANNELSCASCHQQDKAFSDGEALTSIGVSGKRLKRHAPALINLAWMNGLFWDGGAKDIESLAFGPLTHPDEMGQNLKELVLELQSQEKYRKQFRLAFGTDTITSARVAQALAQFQRTLISANSRYDKYVRGENGGHLAEQELQGMALFKQHCASCHATDFFTDNSYHNNGLDSIYSEDFEALAFGRGRISRQQQDIGKYKTPTLRNIQLTAPYMHDGRFATLEEVLDHYRTGVTWSASLAPELQQNGDLGIPIKQEEKKKIILFLNTLTDEDFVQNKALSNPY